MVKKGNRWNLAELQETLVKDAEEKISQGFEEIAEGAKGSGADAPKEGEDTQGTVPAVTPFSPVGEHAASHQGSSCVPLVASGKAERPSVPQAAQATVVRTARMFHKERTQDVLVHCPESLHRRLRERKDHLWDEYGERVTINNMVIEAIALWLDQQESNKVSATT